MMITNSKRHSKTIPLTYSSMTGQSPYERSTYRYPPLLALIMTPNFLLFPEWGKLLFSIADVGIVYLIYAVRLELEKRKQKAVPFCAHFSDSESVNSSDDNDGYCLLSSSIESDSDTNDRNDNNDRNERNDTMRSNFNSKILNQNYYQNQNQNQNQNRKHRRTWNSKRRCVRNSCSVAWLWALNPLAINICTRGSADSLTNCLVLALLHYLLQQGEM